MELRGLGLALAWAAGCGPQIAPGPTLADRAAERVALTQAPVETGDTFEAAIRFQTGYAHDPPGDEGLAWLAARARPEHPGASVVVDAEWVEHRVRCPVAEGEACLDAWWATVLAPPDAASLDRARAAAAAWFAEPPPAELRDALLSMRLYVGHPYGRAPRGRASASARVDLADIDRFRSVNEHRSGALAQLTGAWTPALGQRLRAHLDALPARRPADRPRPAPEPARPPDWSVRGVSPAATVAVGRPLPAASDHPDWPALWVGAHTRAAGTEGLEVWAPPDPCAPIARAHGALALVIEGHAPVAALRERALAGLAAPAPEAFGPGLDAAVRACAGADPDLLRRVQEVSFEAAAAAWDAWMAPDQLAWLHIYPGVSAESSPPLEDSSTPVVHPEATDALELLR